MIREMRLKSITLQFIDRSIVFGVIEYVIVKVDKFIFLIDIAVLDFDEDKKDSYHSW